MSTNSSCLFEYQSPGEANDDALFLERLDTFMEKSLTEIKAFAEREMRPYDETRRCIAQWHAKYLFQPHFSPSTDELSSESPNRIAQVRAVLCDTSRILENLSSTAGVQSFVLAVDPTEPSDGGFLGGSVVGREFWRGLRGGGEHGAKAFKAHCNAHLQNTVTDRGTSQPPTVGRRFSTPSLSNAASAKSIKNELYEGARSALRVASGIRHAEMKWSNPERLDVYGVRLVGWPEGIPAQNPSSLKAGQNKALLEALQSGSMRFERSDDPTRLRPPAQVSDPNEEDAAEDFSWAYDADAGLNSPPRPEHATVPPSDPPPAKQYVFVDSRPRLPVASTSESAAEKNPWGMGPVRASEVDPVLAKENPRPDGHAMDRTLQNQSESVSERPRKRPRNEDPGGSGIT